MYKDSLTPHHPRGTRAAAAAGDQDVSPKESALPVPHPGKAPCLFDLRADPSERANQKIHDFRDVNQTS